MLRDLAALLFTLVFPTIAAWLYFIVLAGSGDEVNYPVQVAYAIGKMIQFGFPIAFMWWFYRAEIRWRAPQTIGLLLGLGFGLFTAAGMFVLYFGSLRHTPAMADAPEMIWRKLVELNCATPARYLLLTAFLSLIHAGLEEYYWRWFVFGMMRRYLALLPAALIASVGFMAHHVVILCVYFPGQFWSVVMPFSLGVAAGGAVWCFLYERSESLLGPWLSHIMVDAAIFAIGFDLLADKWP